jgi:peptidoglycan/LPS O-acetylase OafA/YrhL
MKETRIVELDGLRGVACLIVLTSHYFGEIPHGTRFLVFGWLGVDIFFVLSGFLIGSIILEHHTEPTFLKSFYLRRAARIVPVYALGCAVSLSLISLTHGLAWSDHPYSAGVYAVFGSNIAMSIWGGGGTWLLPTWTLAVEEQFYLLLPALVIVTPTRLLAPVLIALWSSAAIFRAWIADDNPLAAFSLLPGRMDLLLAGVLIAIARRRLDLTPYVFALRATPLLAIMMLLMLGLVFGSSTVLFVILGPMLASVGIASFLLAIMLGAPEGRRYRSPVLRYLGQISYALYLVHQPISGLLHGILLDRTPDIGTASQWAVTILAVAVSIAVAAASWRWLESPILRWAKSSTSVPSAGTTVKI